MRENMPSLRGRYFNVGLCCDCWDRLNPERALDPERKRDLEDGVLGTTAGWDKEDIVANRCAACDEQPHAGIFVRVNLESLRAMRPK